ncbi:hypothetical protein ASE04_05720 [Rhizobium sp. Root708]|uniref:hypothetical protein n=1 Tax=Rhizobium sp. Root708 TaxID=1736592 RepID=UPI0006FF967D|nr:hypothetical protein [Rhizobium sp. Root708]KRB55205.1 hypothetical protein ASE04_05720 [Rhizobium sp. Root708]
MTGIDNQWARSSDSSGALSTLSAFFDSRSDAESAIKRLKDFGLRDDYIRFMPGDEAEGEFRRTDAGGWWAGLADWFFPAGDRALFTEGLRRGGYLVSAQVDKGNYERVHAILDDEGSIDIDERADQWRGEGWDSTQHGFAEVDDPLSSSSARAARIRDFERSPRVRAYGVENLMNADKPAPGLDEIAPPSDPTSKI